MDKVWNQIESRTLVYGGTWDNAQSTIRATVFGVMVELGQDRIKHYRSDLYHDCLWINENIVGPMQFEWIARESGTHCGEVCLYVKDEDWPKSARYRFDIREDGNQKWVLDIYEAGPNVPMIPHLCEECGTMVAKYVDYMQMWLCSDYCTGKAENRLNTVLPTDIDYSENEAYQLQLTDLGVKYREAMEKVEPRTPGHLLACRCLECDPFDLGVKNQDDIPEQSWVDRHAALDISECDVALAVEGCIFHPAPVDGWSKIPTLRNESTIEPEAQRKEKNMDDIIRDLREKYEEASSSKDQLEDYQSNINDAVDELETYMSDLDDLITNLDQLPEVSIYVDLETVNFDS